MFSLWGMTFTLLDLATLMIVLLSAFMAYGHGLTHALLSLLSWIIAIFGTLWLYPFLRPILGKIFRQEKIIVFGTLGITSLALLILFLSISARIAQRIQRSEHAKLDKILGITFGIIRGFFIASLITLVVDMVGATPHFFKKSFFYPIESRTSALILALTPRIFLFAKNSLEDQYNIARYGRKLSKKVDVS